MTAVPMNVFISYSVADKDFVERLLADLQAQGITAWVGHINLRSGQNWPNAIEAAIDSAQAVLVIWTPDAKKSQYVQKEYSYAIEHNHRVIPLIVKPCELTMLLNDLHWLDFTKPALRASQTNVLIDALKNNESLPRPATPPPTSPAQHVPAYLLSGVLFLLLVAGLGFILHGAKQQSTMVTPTVTASTIASPAETSTSGSGGTVSPAGTAAAAGSSGGATKNGATSTPTPAPSGHSPTLSPTSPPATATSTDIPTVTPTATSTRIPQ